MAIFQGDVVISTMIRLCIDEMRKNPWLVQDMLSDFVTNPYLQDKYGQKAIDSCIEWLSNNQIDVYLRGRDDKDRLPCVTIQMGGSSERGEYKLMGDASTEIVKLLPNQIGKPIAYVIKPFTPVGYDDISGEVEVDPSLDLSGVSEGMILVNPSNGNGYVIQDISNNTIQIESNQEIVAAQFGIVPQYQYYEARVEHSFFDESYVIGTHAHGDAQNVLFLWSIVKYAILRYRESLLEANGFTESSIDSGNPDFDDSYTTAGGEKAWARFLTLKGVTENTWIKSPKRILESIVFKKETSTGYIGGISIISNTDPDVVDKSKVSWYTDLNSEADAENEEG